MTLDELLPHHQWLLIEGQPGAGKTTLLRLVAAMLARAALGIPCPDGASWAGRHLGLEPGDLSPEADADRSTSSDADPVVPVLLRAQLLVPLLEAHDGPPDRAALVGFIEKLCCDADEHVPARAWSDRLASGQAVLLLDGVDEVADHVLRERLFAMLKDAQRGFRCRIVATSRPIETDTFTALGFAWAVVEPFGRDEIKSFVARWVWGLRACDDLDGGSGLLAEHQRQLEGAILSRAPIRRIAENPVMLTCLAVVHFNEGRLPEARARLVPGGDRVALASANRAPSGCGLRRRVHAARPGSAGSLDDDRPGRETQLRGHRRGHQAPVVRPATPVPRRRGGCAVSRWGAVAGPRV